MTNFIKQVPGSETQVGDILVSIPPHTVVALGEYAEEGEPDILVRVVHAVDSEGNDISDKVAKAIYVGLGLTFGLTP